MPAPGAGLPGRSAEHSAPARPPGSAPPLRRCTDWHPPMLARAHLAPQCVTIGPGGDAVVAASHATGGACSGTAECCPTGIVNEGTLLSLGNANSAPGVPATPGAPAVVAPPAAAPAAAGGSTGTAGAASAPVSAAQDPTHTDCGRGQSGVCIDLEEWACLGAAPPVAGFCAGPAQVQCCPSGMVEEVDAVPTSRCVFLPVTMALSFVRSTETLKVPLSLPP